MASNLDDATFNGYVAAIATASSENARQRAVGAAVSYLAQTDTIDVWANNLANKRGYHDRVGREDIPGVIAEKMMKSLAAVNAEKVLRVSNWASYLFGQADNAVLDYLASGAVTVASGMSGANRRSNTINIAHRDLLATLGREPSREEIMSHANQHLLATRKDAARQGALIKDSDFGQGSNFAVSIEGLSEVGFDIAEESALEEQIEASLAAQKLVERCRAEYPTETLLASVAQTWIRLHLEGERVSVVRISNELNVSRATSKLNLQMLESVLAMMRDDA